MSESSAEDSVVDADTASDEEVLAALGLDGDDEGEGDGDEQEHDEEGQEPESVENLPQWAQVLIKELRTEAANQRVKARDQARKTTSVKKAAPSAQDLEAAEERGRQAASLEYGVRLAGAEVRAALAGVVPEDKIADIVEDLNLSRYVGDDGTVDAEAVANLKQKYAGLVGARKTTTKINNGRTGTAPTSKGTDQQFADAVGTFFS